jgi:Fe-Mn family superoxide dismutase
MTFTLPPLPYEYNALEPYISEQIMTLHHTKHHQTYVNALNAATQAYENASSAKERISLQAALKFNGGGGYLILDNRKHAFVVGPDSRQHPSLIPIHHCDVGHINHSLFWKNLAKASDKGGIGGTLPDGPLSQAIANDFGSLDALKKQFNATAAAIQGSGWAWLVSRCLSHVTAGEC